MVPDGPRCIRYSSNISLKNNFPKYHHHWETKFFVFEKYSNIKRVTISTWGFRRRTLWVINLSARLRGTGEMYRQFPAVRNLRRQVDTL